MQINYKIDQCLSYHQLEWFVLEATNTDERIKIAKHISTCELCARAIEGFAASPFTIDVVNKLNREIDMKSKAPMKWNSLFFTQVSIVVVSLFAIIGFYVIAESVSENKNKSHSVIAVKPIETRKAEKTETIAVPENNAGKTSAVLPLIKNEKLNSVETHVTPVESLTGIPASLNDLIKNDAGETTPNSIKVDGVIFIDGFKVVDYQNLYLKHRYELPDFAGYTPAFIENKKTNNYFYDEDGQKIVLLKELKKGLHFYKKQKYEDAITAFQFLHGNNGNDVNALFYLGLSCYESKRFALAENYFRKVLSNTNHNFYEEAKWKLANTLQKEGKKEEAKKMFEEIKNGGGFYNLTPVPSPQERGDGF